MTFYAYSVSRLWMILKWFKKLNPQKNLRCAYIISDVSTTVSQVNVLLKVLLLTNQYSAYSLLCELV